MRAILASARGFALILALLLTLVAANHKVDEYGDFVEYSLIAMAVASHGTPDIRLEDVQQALRIDPEPVFAEPWTRLAEGMRANQQIAPYPFNRGRNGGYYSIHFFVYPALAAAPMRLLQLAGLPPFKCFQLVNLGFLFILGMCMFRLFGSAPKALTGLALFMVCGGVLYWNWCSPECMSAAALLSGLILFSTGAPRVGGILAGLAAMQNPPIAAFFGFAPLMHVALHHRRGTRWSASARAALGPAYLQGMLATAILLMLPIAFSLWQFGVPSLIAKYSTTPALIGAGRLYSFFFDLNQGMIIGVPLLMAALLLWDWRPGQRLRNGAMLALATAFSLTLAVPALAAQNWNSGANGMMRYAFWSAMPFLFAFLMRLRQSPRWPVAVLLAVGLGQAACMAGAGLYGYTELSPLAKRVIEYAPAFYNPDPEIFYERVAHVDVRTDPASQIAVYETGGKAVKALYGVRNPAIDARLCGDGLRLAAANHYVDVGNQWRYVNGSILCEQATGHARLDAYAAQQFRDADAVRLQTGWGGVEFGGVQWNGAWTDGAHSRLTIRLVPGRNPANIVIQGHYYEGNQRTRVAVNGVDLGWHQLDRVDPLLLPPAARSAATLSIELENEAPLRPVAGTPDQRQLAFFMQNITVE
jgi:hypothetical protein